MTKSNEKTEGDTLTLENTKVSKPSLFKVLLHNDDYTPMDFVVMILETISHKKQEEAVSIMLNVHQKGIGICGVYTYEIAESKSRQVIETAKHNDYPLQSSIEPG